MAQHKRIRPANFHRRPEQRDLPESRSTADQSGRGESDRALRDRDPQLRGERRDYLLYRDKSTKATRLVGHLHVDPAFNGGRSVGHGVLHGRGRGVELHRGLDLRQRRLQVVQIRTSVQLVSKHLYTGADRSGQVLCYTIPDERHEYR